MSMYTYQDSLPKLPLPTLEQTCQKLMEWSEVLLTEEEIRSTRNAINAFQEPNSKGPLLQEHLRDLSRDPEVRNWLEPFWTESYLSNPSPLPTGGNVTFILDKNPQSKDLPLPEFLASLIVTLFEFNGCILKESLDIDYQKDQPLCMSQYTTLLSTTRIPGSKEDFHATESATAHVIILFKGHYYKIKVLDRERRILDYHTLLQQIKDIMNGTQTTNSLTPGTLTTLPRRKWAELRHYLADLSLENQDNLHQIEQALAIFIIDEAFHARESDMFKHFFTGDPYNRWYDKSLQFILNEAGDFGINYEHSGVDGTTLGNLVNYLYENVGPQEEVVEETGTTQVTELSFTLDDLLKAEIEEAGKLHKQDHDDLVMETLNFSDFGKDRIKALQISPDSFIQLGIQLAQYKVFQKVYNVYESVMTKQFLGGRTEAMRPLTRASLAFVQNPTLENLRAASLKHVERINECKNGQGIERHLFGLKKIHEQHYPSEPLPDIFSSPGYAAITTDHFSTSTSSSAGMRYAGYGPSIKDGFGVRYLIYNDQIHVVLSSRKIRREALMNLKESLKNSFTEMTELG